MDEIIANNFQELCRYTSEKCAQSLVSYLNEILLINEHINLTSITDFQEACLLHLEDSLVALPDMKAAAEGNYCDIGCGGGFPGVVLGAASGRETHLVDSRAKKIRVVSEAIQKSGIDDFATFKGFAERIEDFSAKHRAQYAVVTARALSSLPSLLELAAPLLAKSGIFIALKSIIDAEEEEWGMSLLDMLGLELVNKRELELSDGVTQRVIYSFKKTGKSRIKLPRRVSLAQKSPLKPN